MKRIKALLVLVLVVQFLPDGVYAQEGENDLTLISIYKPILTFSSDTSYSIVTSGEFDGSRYAIKDYWFPSDSQFVAVICYIEEDYTLPVPEPPIHFASEGERLIKNEQVDSVYLVIGCSIKSNKKDERRVFCQPDDALIVQKIPVGISFEMNGSFSVDQEVWIVAEGKHDCYWSELYKIAVMP